MGRTSSMRELILGGAGLIGSELAARLRRAGHQVRSLDLQQGVDLRRFDLSCFRDYDRIWFLAWDTGGATYLEAADRQHGIFKHNCELSLRVFDALATTGTPFLFTTSQLAGLPNGYGTTKLLGENWTVQLGGKLARLWNVYGWESPRGRSHVISDFVLQALTERRICCRTDGRARRRFLFKSDAAAALEVLFGSSLPVADIAGPEWRSIRQIAEEVGRQLHVEVTMGSSVGTEVLLDPAAQPRGWQPTVSFEDGIARVIGEARVHLTGLQPVLV
jgi:nucleoside-diphosphate-sugar epimerase